MRMLFEIRDLLFSTPTTVSRADILYVSDDRDINGQIMQIHMFKNVKFDEWAESQLKLKFYLSINQFLLLFRFYIFISLIRKESRNII
ncbi:unnamed protein product [Paramecium sonneborni]|uniref:Uncharacterized protein n=1 Tax=Paramecium sonneborni TaxID=65129 RepID=A0A8S1QCG6_9CILI|nr:unnamed protein product [Paramecium sonneborni]